MPDAFSPHRIHRASASGNRVSKNRTISASIAAWTAARYLCADGKDLASVEGWNAAVHSYNHDNTYVVNVAAAASTYADRVR